MTRRQLPARIRSLQGLSVVVTGQLRRRPGQWVKREEARLLALRAGARLRVRAKVSFEDDLLVIGSSELWKYGNYGMQEERALDLQDQGSKLQIIDQDGFFALLDGGCAYTLTRGSTPVDYPKDLLLYRPVDPKIAIAAYAWKTSGRALSRAVVKHRYLQELVAEHLDEVDLVPLSPSSGDCAFDVAWVDGRGRLHVVEIKSLSRAEILRLGIGQVLDYATRLRARGHEVVPHLLLASAPADPEHWAAVSAIAGVRLTWSVEGLTDPDSRSAR